MLHTSSPGCPLFTVQTLDVNFGLSLSSKSIKNTYTYCFCDFSQIIDSMVFFQQPQIYLHKIIKFALSNMAANEKEVV